MDFIISLAHFCEVHGPTSILCTQVSTGPCLTCNPCVTPPADDHHPSSAAPSSSYLYDSSSAHPTGLQHLASPFETPPTSPRSPMGPHNPYNPYFPHFADHDSLSSRRLSSAGFDAASASASDGDSCENCSFQVPRDLSDRLPDGAPGSPTKDGRGRNGSPILRTSQSVMALGPGSGGRRGRARDSSQGNDTPESARSEQRNYTSASHSPPGLDGDDTSSISSSSPASLSNMYAPPSTHTHTLNYMTTRQPHSATAYSLLRRSCIRTLSCEMLPRGSPSGPIYFGDPVAGYTIAYVFRLPDPRARGRLRTYALIALGGRDSWRVGQAIVPITKFFENIASRIVAMADRVLERESTGSRANSISQQGQGQGQNSRPSTAIGPSPSTPPPPLSTSVSSAPSQSSPQQGQFPGGSTIRLPPPLAPSSTNSSPVHRTFTPVSSFLTAKKVDPDGYPRISREVMRAKGLAEIVGNDRFFVELHGRFCELLCKLIHMSTSS